MNARSRSLAWVAVFFAGMLVGSLFTRPSVGQRVADRPVAVGRFQIAASNPSIYVIDTTTGHCWERNTYDEDRPWKDCGTPPSVEK